jgi:pentatricopeptide repeat protein
VFIKMRIRDVVAWTAMILGHVKCGQGHIALALFQQMQQEGVEPNPVTFVGAVAACASAEALEEGRHVEKQIIQSGYESDVFISNSLIDMYSKCGSIKDASRVFHRMPTKDVVSWTAMLGGFAMHGHAKEAVVHFEMMCEGTIELNSITFVSLLSACSHAGLVDEGLQYIESMGFVYSCPATLKHYSCTVDLLGRAGYLEEAEELIKTMSCEPDVALWMTLLGASRVHRNVEVGERIAKKVLELDPGNTSGYVVLSNM